MRKKTHFIVLATLLVVCANKILIAQTLQLSSPDKNLSLEVSLHNKIYYQVLFKNERVLQNSPLSMTIDNKTLGVNPKVITVTRNTIHQSVPVRWGNRKTINDEYNQMIIECEGNYSVEFRVYNHGAAYRFVTRMKEKSVIVNTEEVSFRFNFNVSAWLPDSKSYETNYTFTKLDAEKITDFNNSKSKLFLPIVVQASNTVKVLISEAGLYDYPSLFLDRGNDYENFLTGKFEPFALATKAGGFSNYAQQADKEASYIAKTSGTREFPWRLMIVADDDRVFVDNDLVYQLSKPSMIGDASWVKPGKVAWEWWHDYVVNGAKFKGGVNTQTYLYHIDFASKYNLEYILIDWLWTDKYDLTVFNPEVDLKKIIEYGNSKGVGVLLWCPAHTLYQQLDTALDLFHSFGAAGIKADFFGREDQTGIRMYEDIAKAAALRKMIVDFHGATKPTGLSRTYPNILNYEAVAGNEYNKLSDDRVTISHKVLLPFIRGAQGPMDFTPGGMRNVQSGHHLRFTLPLVHGSRCNEMALFVLYNEPLKMVCDAPSVYEQEPAVIDFISKIPTTWDDTKVLQAVFGDHLIMARLKDNTWYVAGICGKESKDINIDFSFLSAGNYAATIMKDGPNADRIGTDFSMENVTLSDKTTLPVTMVPGGGFLIRVVKQ